MKRLESIFLLAVHMVCLMHSGDVQLNLQMNKFVFVLYWASLHSISITLLVLPTVRHPHLQMKNQSYLHAVY